jgi:hypothetical protein
MDKDIAAGVVGIVIAIAGATIAGFAPRLQKWTTDVDHGVMSSGKDFRADRDLDIETWAESPERDAYRSRRALIYVRAIGAALVTIAGAVLLGVYRENGVLRASSDGYYLHVAGLVLVIIGAASLAYCAMPYAAARSAFRHRRAATASALVDRAVAAACSGNSALGLAQLFELNRRQLDEYQATTRKQQRSAFLLAQAASVAAFAVLVAGVVVALAAGTNVEKYVAGGLSGLGSALSAYLAATFFASYRDANRQMNRYYLEPQRTGRMLAAERAIRKITAEGDRELLTEIVKTVLLWEMPPDAQDAPPVTPSGGASGTAPEASG